VPVKEGERDGDSDDMHEGKKGENAEVRKMRWRKTTFNMGLVYGGEVSDEE
jgi:hypothetical protein